MTTKHRTIQANQQNTEEAPLKRGVNSRFQNKKEDGPKSDEVRVFIIPKDERKIGHISDYLFSNMCSDLSVFSNVVIASTDIRGLNIRLISKSPEFKCAAISLSMALVAEHARVLVVPGEATMEKQRELNYSLLNRLKPHECAFGFARGKSAIDCAWHHIRKDGDKTSPPELLIKMDISNFFNTITRDMVEVAMAGHKIQPESIKEIADICTLDLIESKTIYKIAAGYISSLGNAGARKLQPAILGAIKQFYMGKFDSVMCRRLIHPDHMDRFAYVYAQCKKLVNLVNKISAMKKFIEFHGAKKLSTVYKAINRYTTRICAKYPEHEWKNVLDDMSYCFLSMAAKISENKDGTPIGKEIMLYQGGPSSPPMSNLVFKLLDYRFAGLAKKHGGKYGRYADDLQFSFPERKTTKNINMFIDYVSKILGESGYKMNKKKTVVAGTGGRMKVIGYNINSGKPTIGRGYRKKVENFVNNLRKDESGFGSDKYVAMGMVSYLHTAHPELAEKLRVKSQKIKTGRKIQCDENNTEGRDSTWGPHYWGRRNW